MLEVTVQFFNDRINNWITCYSTDIETPEELADLLKNHFVDDTEFDIYINGNYRVSLVSTCCLDEGELFSIVYIPDNRGYAPKSYEFQRSDYPNFTQVAIKYIIDDIFNN